MTGGIRPVRTFLALGTVLGLGVGGWILRVTWTGGRGFADQVVTTLLVLSFVCGWVSTWGLSLKLEGYSAS